MKTNENDFINRIITDIIPFLNDLITKELNHIKWLKENNSHLYLLKKSRDRVDDLIDKLKEYEKDIVIYTKPQMIFECRISLDKSQNPKYSIEEINMEILGNNIEFVRGLMVRKSDGVIMGEVLEPNFVKTYVLDDVRNKLSPFKNLISLLESSEIMYHHENEIHKIIDSEINVCKTNLEEILNLK